MPWVYGERHTPQQFAVFRSQTRSGRELIGSGDRSRHPNTNKHGLVSNDVVFGSRSTKVTLSPQGSPPSSPNQEGIPCATQGGTLQQRGRKR